MKEIRSEEDFEEQRFIDQVSKNLRLGRSLLLIVGRLQEGVRTRWHLFSSKTPQLGYQLALLEIGIYREPTRERRLVPCSAPTLARDL